MKTFFEKTIDTLKWTLPAYIFDLADMPVYKMKVPLIGEGHQLIGLRNLKFSAEQYIVKVKARYVPQSEQVIFE